MKAVVVGNCQARPVASLIKGMRPDIDFADPIILQLATEATEGKDNQTFREVDVIFAQLTADTFRPAHLSTLALRQAFGRKTVVWPNIFFAGQQPYLRYFTHADLGRMMGPFEAMHDLRLYRSWLRTGTVNPEAVLAASDAEVDATITSSLNALIEKEARADVKVSDLIREKHPTAQLFFTFNHPTRQLLADVARRLLAAAGLRPEQEELDTTEPLGRYRVPGIGQPVVLQGDQLPLTSRKAIAYDVPELCLALQEVYDANPAFRDRQKMRLTPLIGWEHEFLSGGQCVGRE